MFKYSNTNKRYYTLDYYYKNKFHSKVAKISLDASFTCPNIDGKVGHNGCIYCLNGSSDFFKKVPLLDQFEERKKIMLNKWPNSKLIAYFQANSNTYAPVFLLKEKFEPILRLNNVIGINIATRADCINNDVLNYLIDLNNRTYLTIELGLQTIHEKTAKFINRCHSLDCFIDCVKKLRKNHINVVVHIINGLPGETKNMMLETVKFLNKLDIQGIKIHMLSIVNGTRLATIYKKKPFKILQQQQYINIVCDQLELLNENIVIHRLTGDPIKETLIEPKWILNKINVLNGIDKEMKKRNSYQGCKNSVSRI